MRKRLIMRKLYIIIVGTYIIYVYYIVERIKAKQNIKSSTSNVNLHQHARTCRIICYYYFEARVKCLFIYIVDGAWRNTMFCEYI